MTRTLLLQTCAVGTSNSCRGRFSLKASGIWITQERKKWTRASQVAKKCCLPACVCYVIKIPTSSALVAIWGSRLFQRGGLCVVCELSLASGVTEDWTNQEPPRHRERDNKCDIPNVAAALQFAEPTGVLFFQLLRMPAKLSRDMLFSFAFYLYMHIRHMMLRPRVRGTKRNERPPANN